MAPVFEVQTEADGEGSRIEVRRAGSGETRAYRIKGGEQRDDVAFYRELARDWGMRLPRSRELLAGDEGSEPRWRPLITENLSPHILAGYGDPAVLKTEEGWYLVATSNDAPDAFPILLSADLEAWEPVGFVFPEG